MFVYTIGDILYFGGLFIAAIYGIGYMIFQFAKDKMQK